MRNVKAYRRMRSNACHTVWLKGKQYCVNFRHSKLRFAAIEEIGATICICDPAALARVNFGP